MNDFIRILSGLIRSLTGGIFGLLILAAWLILDFNEIYGTDLFLLVTTMVIFSYNAFYLLWSGFMLLTNQQFGRRSLIRLFVFFSIMLLGIFGYYMGIQLEAERSYTVIVICMIIVTALAVEDMVQLLKIHKARRR